jgi:hypothetical protein
MIIEPRIIALYLPQFHPIPENDEWWGKGFTEWDNVRKAKPIFKNHRQPRLPLDNNYYNLMNDNTFTWQVTLAKKYSIDGFCFYHYWFNGKLLLEKPVEKYLNQKKWNLSFCFSWANEPWTRSWDGKNKNILIDQCYNGMPDIISHIEYLLPFFSDDRYIKIENKPLFLLYRAANITYLEELINTWNLMAKKAGFNGIYFCETLTGFQLEKYSNSTESIVYMEPMWTIGLKNNFIKLLTALHSPINLNRIEDYDRIWKTLLEKENINAQSFPGAFVDWDNSPRKKKKNLVFKGSTPAKFRFYLQKQFIKAQEYHSPFIFINAWNEWAEGTYLEPDVYYKMEYLEAIRDIKQNKS